MVLSSGFLGFVGFARVRLKSVRASACFHSFSSCSSDGVWMLIGIFSPLFIGFGALMYVMWIFVSKMWLTMYEAAVMLS